MPGNCRQLGCRLNAFCSAYFSDFFLYFVCLRIVMKIFHGKFETLAYPTTTSIVTSDVRPAVCPSVRNSIYSDSHINKTLMGPRAREVSFHYYFGEIYGFVDNCLALEPLDACANLEFLPRIGWKAVCLFFIYFYGLEQRSISTIS